MKDDFPRILLSYNRFTELVGQNLIAISLFLKASCLGEYVGKDLMQLLIAYSFLPKKPSVKYQTIKST